jgi:hypothetical protein
MMVPKMLPEGGLNTYSEKQRKYPKEGMIHEPETKEWTWGRTEFYDTSLDCAIKKRRLDGPTVKKPVKERPAELPWTPVEVSAYDKVDVVTVMQNVSGDSGHRYDAKENTHLQKMECLWQVLKTIRAARDKGCDLRGSVIDWDMAKKVDDIERG